MTEAHADLILTDADVYCVDAPRRWARTLAVHDGRIAAVGDDDARALAGPSTEVISLEGRMVLPAFQDAHVHPAFAGRNLLNVNLDDLRSVDAYLDRIGAYAREHPDDEWIIGGGWAMFLFERGAPGRELLDRVVPDRPVFLMNRDVHGAWVNSRALQLAGIDRHTPDPWDGQIVRDPSTGEPNGTLFEGAAYSYRTRYVSPPSAQEWRESLLAAQRHLHSLGITAWQDAWVEPDLLQAYRALDDEGALTARVSASLWWDRHRGLEQIDELVERRDWGTRGHVRASTVKIMVDGVIEDGSCALLEPYLATDAPMGERGIAFVDAKPLAEAVTRLDGLGFQVHMHAIGDRAVRNALDAVGAARDVNGARDARHHVAHLQVVHPDDVPRFRELGVVANVQPLWACADPQMTELTLPYLGEERASWQYPFESLRRSGAVIAMGSDWGVSSPNPLLEMEVAVRRVDPDHRDDEPFLPDQRVDLPSALAAFTSGSAYVNFDADAGSIEVGKRADLAVVDRNLFAPDAGPPGEARVQMTLASGIVVHQDLG